MGDCPMQLISIASKFWTQKSENYSINGTVPIPISITVSESRVVTFLTPDTFSICRTVTITLLAHILFLSKLKYIYSSNLKRNLSSNFE